MVGLGKTDFREALTVRVAHFDCFNGASGDMILAALIDAGAPMPEIARGLESLHLPLNFAVERVTRCGIAGVQAIITSPAEQIHRHVSDIEAIVNRGGLSEKQRELAKRMFRRLAEAEAAVHNIPIEKVHFHEVGAVDSIADVVGAAIGIDLLQVERITARSIPVGSGMIDCEHGRMPVPAPATARLLAGVPIAASEIQTELTTPTGAAILTTIVDEWVDSPAMTIESIGCGAGSKDFKELPNLLRLFVGTAANQPIGDRVWLLETNLDDVTGEVIGHTTERLFVGGALDVWTTAIQMKKNRPGVQVSVLADESTRESLEQILFRETGTLGVRRCRYDRTKRQREESTVETHWGPVRLKAGKPEYDDCARIAREHEIAVRDVISAVAPSRSGPAAT
jgi:uncharacterized protein (TIGR00299 family) protein